MKNIFFVTTCYLFLMQPIFAVSDRFEFSLYGGLNQTTMNLGHLDFGSEVDKLVAKGNQQQKSNFTSGMGFHYILVQRNQWVNKITAGLVAYYFQTNQRGDVWQFESPSYNNFNYKASLQSSRLMLDNEIVFQPLAGKFFPFIELGLGVAHNRLKYQDYPSYSSYTGGTKLHQHSENQFAYAAGLGLSYQAFSKVSFSLRYLYTNLGEAATSRNGYNEGDIVLASPLKMHLYTQSWLLGVTYLF